jgi:hypothetical protein
MTTSDDTVTLTLEFEPPATAEDIRARLLRLAARLGDGDATTEPLADAIERIEALDAAGVDGFTRRQCLQHLVAIQTEHADRAKEGV